MVFHLLFFTVTISLRKFSGLEVDQARRAEFNEQLMAENRQRCIAKQRLL